MAKLLIILSTVAFLNCWLHVASADGVGEFLEQLCSDYPSWLAANYPDPSPELYAPINVTLETVSEDDHVNASFTNYQMFWHANPENWEFSGSFVDLSSGTIEASFKVRKTKFGGKYSAEGIYDGVSVSGQGTWNISTVDPSYISFSLHYYGAKVTEDDYIDLNAGDAQSLNYYVPLVGTGSVRELDGFVAGGGGGEKLLIGKIFDALEMQTQYMNEHPLPIPLNTYLQVAFASTSIPEMPNWIKGRKET